jgi:hypothetical protein
MNRSLPGGIAVVLLSVALGPLGSAHGAGSPPRSAASGHAPCGLVKLAPTYKHVIVIMEENASFATIYRSRLAPYVNRVIVACGLATNYHNITHESLPDYLGITSGVTLGQLRRFLTDCTPGPGCTMSSPSIFSELGTPRGWKSYSESMPSACDKYNTGHYSPNLNPAVYYSGLKGCILRDVTLGTTANSPLLKDFSREGTAPAFATITPNLCDDMHGASGCPPNRIETGDRWLATWLPLITATTVYRSDDTAIFITWDEGEPDVIGENCATHKTDQSCHVATIVIAPSVRRGTKVGTYFTHYSLLKTVESLLHASQLGLARRATGLSAAFNL